MRIFSARPVPKGALLLSTICCLLVPVTPAWSQPDKAPAADKPAAEKPADKSPLPPLPPPAHVQQSIQLDGKTLKYTVTVGSLPVRDKDAKVAGDVVITAYTVEGDNRPVTFAFNGGPGASSVYLNFGAIGPKHMSAGNEGDSPSRSLTTRAPGSISLTSSSSIPSAPASAAPSFLKIRRRSSSSPPHPTFSTSRASSTTGSLPTAASRRASTSSAKAMVDSAARASPTTCNRSLASP